jgi:hypothetical protein
MTQLILILLSVALAIPLGARPAGAQLTAATGALDHLFCYKMKDPLKPELTVDLATVLQPEFSQAGCRIVKPTKFCVPTTKTVLPPAPTGPNIIGQPLRDDYVCYMVKCPKDVPDIPDKLVVDQFGQRRQQKYMPVELCVPARKGSPPCFRIGSGKKCGGVCPNNPLGVGNSCRFDDILQDCTCNPQPCGGKPDKTRHCGGQCPAPLICHTGLDAAGKPACVCDDPPPPPCGLNPATGTCGGTCDDPAAKCEFVITATGPDCVCQPPVQQCARDSVSGQCGGPCPPGLTCVLDPAINDCRCESVLPCGQNTVTGQCGGACPTGMICRFITVAGATGCDCVTP